MQNSFFNIDSKLLDCAACATERIRPQFTRLEEITEYNQQKVLSAFINNAVSESHFSESTGYGYADRGRDTLDKVCAASFGAEDALIRHSFACGTHTLAVALFGVLRPGDTMLCVTGTPYDTIHAVIGLKGQGQGSLKDFGIRYRQTALLEDGTPDWDSIDKQLKSSVRLVYIQRSRGYTLRPSFSSEDIGEIVHFVRQRSDAVVMVDNCYGEFVGKTEPTDCGADLIVGSLIKNPGGGIAKTGGYIAGKAALVEQCAYRMTTPGLGREIGATLGQNRSLYMGLFNAPHVVGEAMKTAVFTAALFEELGFEVSPTIDESRNDIIQAVLLKTPEALIAFCQGMQKGAPVDSAAVPEPWDMPGYDSKVIMAAGAFTLGASIELSADAPLREPFAAWMQGGLNYHSAKTGVLLAAQSMLEKGLIG